MTPEFFITACSILQIFTGKQCSAPAYTHVAEWSVLNVDQRGFAAFWGGGGGLCGADCTVSVHATFPVLPATQINSTSQDTGLPPLSSFPCLRPCRGGGGGGVVHRGLHDDDDDPLRAQTLFLRALRTETGPTSHQMGQRTIFHASPRCANTQTLGMEHQRIPPPLLEAYPVMLWHTGPVLARLKSLSSLDLVRILPREIDSM